MFSISLATELICSSVKVLQQACVRLVLRTPGAGLLLRQLAGAVPVSY